MWDLVLEFAAVIGWCRSTAEHLAWQSSPSFSSLRSACITSILGGGFVVTRFRLLFVCRAIFSSTHLPRASRSIACHFAADALYSLLWCLVEYIAHFTSNHNLLTVMYMRYYLPLNKSSLVFFPPQSLVDLQGPYIVQVMIKQAHKEAIHNILTFYLAQPEITKAIETVLIAHISVPLPLEIQLDGDGYVLRGKRKQWDYGKGLELRWGDQPVRVADEKWLFMFETIPKSSPI